MSLLADYRKHTEERAKLGVPPLALTAEQVAQLVELLKANPIEDADYVMELFTQKVPAGVDDAAYVKAAFLNDIVQGNATCETIDAVKACEILGTMLGGFNVKPLVEALKIDGEVANTAGEQLKNTILVYDAFNDIKSMADSGNAKAQEVLESWANAEWFTNKPELPKEIKLTVYKVPGETN
ncbi:MAG: aconitate hydratase B, partial [Sulfurovaceae bacterium]|nr:aconitate hydratase B [Sulfurovaceae bacterium]